MFARYDCPEELRLKFLARHSLRGSKRHHEMDLTYPRAATGYGLSYQQSTPSISHGCTYALSLRSMYIGCRDAFNLSACQRLRLHCATASVPSHLEDEKECFGEYPGRIDRTSVLDASPFLDQRFGHMSQICTDGRRSFNLHLRTEKW